MGDLFLGQTEIASARVVMPRVGVFYAELTLDTDVLPSGSQTLRTADDSLRLVGTVRSERALVYGGVVELLLIGGADGLSKTLAPREYSDPTVRILLEDICRETGETLSSTSDADVLAGTLPRWSRVECVAGSAIADIAAATQCVWRVLNDGMIWLGRETWPTVEFPDEDIILENAREGSQELRTDNVSATLRPGIVWNGRRVSLVEHRADGYESSSVAWFEPTEPRVVAARDRLKAGFDALVSNITRATQHHALYPATVLGQSADGSVDLQPDAPSLPALVQVPVRSSTPGTSTRVSQGARCLVAFEGGAPNGPAVVAWFVDSHETQHTIDAPEVKIGANATRGIARLNDAVTKNQAFAAWIASVSAACHVAPFTGSEIGNISSASGRGKCD